MTSFRKPAKDDDTAKTEEQSVVATQSDVDNPAWLSPTDPMDTGRWLASREAGRPVANDDATSAQSRGKSYRVIADNLSVSYRTVISACSSMRQKLGVQSLAELIHVAVSENRRRAQ